jgi:acyl-CoA thioester hydrolase
MGCDLPVVEMSLRYHRSVNMGMAVLVKARMAMQGVRLKWDYRIEIMETQELCVTAQVTLVPVDRQKGKIMRQLPPVLQEALTLL